MVAQQIKFTGVTGRLDSVPPSDLPLILPVHLPSWLSSQQPPDTRLNATLLPYSSVVCEGSLNQRASVLRCIIQRLSFPPSNPVNGILNSTMMNCLQ